MPVAEPEDLLVLGDIILPDPRTATTAEITTIIRPGQPLPVNHGDGSGIADDFYYLAFSTDNLPNSQIAGDPAPKYARAWFVPHDLAFTPAQWVVAAAEEAARLEGVAMQRMVGAGWRHREAAALRREAATIASDYNVDTSDLSLSPVNKWEGPLVHIAVTTPDTPETPPTILCVSLTEQQAIRAATNYHGEASVVTMPVIRDRTVGTSTDEQPPRNTQ